ncbi:MAG TPA: hypothetical protein VF258_07310 [Luteolibacter sp.]
MKRCWIHIGMPKTGTTSVQKNLAKVKKPAGWRYLVVGDRPNMGEALYAMFHPEPHQFHWFLKRGETRQQVEERGVVFRDELRKAITECKEEVCIISAEILSIFKPEGIVALRDFIEPLVDEIRIIGYARPPGAFKTSMFQQQVKHGTNQFRIDNISPHYRAKFNKFDKIFGRENVNLRKFDPGSFPNNCIVADFCQQIGIQLPEKTEILSSNESLSREACGILYAYRKFGPGYGVGANVIKENAWVIRTLLGMQGTKLKFSKSVIDQALKKEKDDTLWMENRLGVSLEERDLGGGGEISTETELLTIRRCSCEEFARCCKELHGIELALDTLPAGELVDPAEVAKIVETYRGICGKLVRKRLRRKLSKRERSKSGFRGFLDRAISFCARRS